MSVAKAALLFLAACVVVGCGKAKSTNDTFDTADLVEKVEPAVIVLDVVTPSGSSLGSGFIVKSNGVAVTNFHVIDNALSATARFSNGRTAKVSGVILYDVERDLALLQLEGTQDIPILQLADTLPRKGEATLAFGAPNGLTFTASEGIVSAVRDQTNSPPDWTRLGTWIQTSTPISPGNSGGPLVNRRGEVVAVNTFYFTTGQNLNFAVSAKEVKEVLNKADGLPVRPLPLPSSSPGIQPAMAPQALSERQQRLLQSMEVPMLQRRAQIEKLQDEIEELRQRVRVYMIAADEAGESSIRRQLRQRIEQLNLLAEKPLQFDSLYPTMLRTGQIGTVESSVHVFQVLSKSEGICLALVDNEVLQFRGLELSSVADSARLRMKDGLLFEVVGTTTYPTASGTTNTVFELVCLLDTGEIPSPFAKERVSLTDVPILTKAETAQREAAIQARADLEAKSQADRIQRREEEERKAAELKDSLRQYEVRQREQEKAAEGRKLEAKAAAKLALAMKFLEKKDVPSAKKWLGQVVNDFPSSAAAEQAREQLKKLQ